MGSLFTTDPGVFMAQYPLPDSRYCPRFSGHETFTLRYGWLKKAFDAVAKRGGKANSNEVFLGDGAIAYFGVGKNMVAAIRHWANATRIIKDAQGRAISTTRLGELLFSEQGLDPYMANPSTAWLLHWQLVAATTRTTWHWAFNHYPRPDFDAKSLFQGLQELSQKRGWPPTSPNTLSKDVACFISTYTLQRDNLQRAPEDRLISPLIELQLINLLEDSRDEAFRFMRGSKPSLGNGVFTYALIDFWQRLSPGATTLSFEAIAHKPGSPGRTFLLDEESLTGRLVSLEDFTDGKLRWSETAGLKQVLRQPELDFNNRLNWVSRDYQTGSDSTREERKAA